jgi:mono/diheme cytochrome c family protein
VKHTIRALLILIVLAAVVSGLVAYTIVRRGISARAEPSGVETVMARTMRKLATPAAVRSRANPVPRSDDVVTAAMEHFADHCAVCHGNDGGGDTEMGRGMYPRVPDMRASLTQSLSDGELFSIIENGIRLTGMPAWGTGTAEGERESWALVHFIRHLPALTPEEIERMEALNPKTPDQLKEEDETRRFLSGENPEPAPQQKPAHKGHHDK